MSEKTKPTNMSEKTKPTKSSKQVKVKKQPSKFEVFTYKAWCKKCGICVEFCPTKALGFDEDLNVIVVDPTACIGCEQCEIRCPDYAIEVKEKE